MKMENGRQHNASGALPDRPLERARTRVRSVCASLRSASPDVLDRSLPELQRAASELVVFIGALQLEPHANASHWMVSARQLQREIAQLGTLLESPAQFFSGWVRTRDAMSGGYTAQGAPVPVAVKGRVLLKA